MPELLIEPIYLLLLPIGVAIAVAYTSTGISGANFWVPVYLLWLGFGPSVAFWLALLTMLFGSASGLLGHHRQGTIDRLAAGRMVLAGVPAAAVGALLVPLMPSRGVLALFALFALARAVSLLLPGAGSRAAASERELPAPAVPALGGLLTGVISVGIGAMLLPAMLRSRRFRHHSEATGTTLLVVFVTSLAALLVRLRPVFVEELGRSVPEILGVLVFVVPAVLVGGQIGPRLAQRIPRRSMQRYVAALLLVVCLLMLARLGLAG
jgi:uncharacterized membrane protein YfcA